MSETPWVVELFTEGMPAPAQFPLHERITIGRSDTKTRAAPPDVDLTPYDAEALGVSRLHLVLVPEGDYLMVTDLGSGNGTVLNGTRLEPNKPYALHMNDHLQLGRLHLDIRVVISPAQGGSIIDKQPSVQIHDQPGPGNGQLVLIVEDQPEVANILALLMERAGYKPHISHDVLSGIRVFNQRHPSAVILDLMLPDMNGLEFARYIRRDAHHNDTPIIVASAVKTAERVSEAMKAGADIFLGKPISARELRHVVAALIEQHESGVAAMQTKHLVGTAPLQAMPPESRHDAVVMFVAGHSSDPLTLTVDAAVTFGRTDNNGHHVNLSRYNAVDHGVSRVHMRLTNQAGQFFIEDMNSVNGTYLNGEPLQPGQPVALTNADEVRMGQLRTYVYFLTDRDIQAL